MSQEHVTIVVVDDHVVIRKGLAMLLSLEPDFEVVGTVGNDDRAIETIRGLQPDLILLNQIETDNESVTATLTLHMAFPDTPILVLTSIGADKGFPKSLMRMMIIGLDHLIPREARIDELVQAIRKVAHGEPYQHPLLERHLRQQQSSLPLECYLTPREQQILHSLASPDTYREIAHHLSLSEETVRSHAKNIMMKLNQSSRFLAVLEAVRYGFIDLNGNGHGNGNGNGNGSGNGHGNGNGNGHGNGHNGHEDEHEQRPYRFPPRCSFTEKGLPMCAVTGQHTGPCPLRTSLARGQEHA